MGFYFFDESPVKDYYLQMEQTGVQDSIDAEAYPKPGSDNPIVEVYVYDLAAGKTSKLDVRDGKPFSQNDVVGHYVYAMQWSPDGSELMMNRTNRRQQILELIACNPSTTKCRVVVHEEWPTGWVDNRPQMRYLADRHRFIWESDRTGFSNYYLYDLTGKLLHPITRNATFDSGAIVKVDEAKNAMFYMARDGDNYMKLQLHRVSLDGENDVRLTDTKFNHSVNLSPDSTHFVDVYQTHDQPPASRLVDASSGKVLAEIAKSDMTRFDQLGLKKVEMFTYLAADGSARSRHRARGRARHTACRRRACDHRDGRPHPRHHRGGWGDRGPAALSRASGGPAGSNAAAGRAPAGSHQGRGSSNTTPRRPA